MNKFASRYWGYQRINKMIIRVFLSRKINKVLKAYKEARLSLAETKLAL